MYSSIRRPSGPSARRIHAALREALMHVDSRLGVRPRAGGRAREVASAPEEQAQLSEVNVDYLRHMYASTRDRPDATAGESFTRKVFHECHVGSFRLASERAQATCRMVVKSNAWGLDG